MPADEQGNQTCRCAVPTPGPIEPHNVAHCTGCGQQLLLNGDGTLYVKTEQGINSHWHYWATIWDATVGLMEAFQVDTGDTDVPHPPLWRDLDDTRRMAFVAQSGRATDAIIILVGMIGDTPPEQDTPFGRVILPGQ